MKKNKTRVVYLDLLRIFCCFCIIVLHESGLIYNHQVVWNAFQIIVRPCLLAFMSISGYFLLNERKELSVIEFYTKRLSTIVIPLVAYSILIKLATNIQYSLPLLTGFDKGLAIQIFTGKDSGHLWFVYSMIGIYLITPYLKILLNKLSNKQILSLLSVMFFFVSINPILDYYGLKLTIDIIIGNYLLFYFILGYYISRINISYKNKIIVCILELVNILSVVFFFRSFPPVQSTLYTSSIHILIGVIFYFCVFKMIGDLLKNRGGKIIAFISARTYSIYIVHYFILQYLISLNIFNYEKGNIIITVLLKCLIIFVIGLIISIIIDLLIIKPIQNLINKIYKKINEYVILKKSKPEM